MNAQDHLEITKKRAMKDFENHQIILDDKENGRWRIAKKTEDGGVEGFYATEIISLWGGRLFAGGDIDDCVFAYFSAAKNLSDVDFHLAKLAWIGQCTDVGYYVAQKAAIGLSDSRKLTEEWDPDIAIEQLREMSEDEDNPKKANEVILEAIEFCQNIGDEHLLMNLLYETLGCENYTDIIPESLGKVTSTRVIYAWAACRRLCQLVL